MFSLCGPGRIPGLKAGLALLAALVLCSTAGAKWIDLGGEPAAVNVIETDGVRTVLEFTVGGFEATPVAIEGQSYNAITLPDESVQPVLGFPALPDMRRSIIIPDDREMAVRLLDSEYVEFSDMPVAPSKGVLVRTVDPSAVPYTFDPFYAGAGIYPASPVEGHEPYIMRDYRGMVVDANVFQYFPATTTLRVYTRMLIEVAPSGPGAINVLHRSAPPTSVDREFEAIYARHFLNFDQQRYVPVPEDGGILIITYDVFYNNLLPLLEWKLQKGIPSRMVRLSEVGSTPAQIKTYIQNEYNARHIAFVLLAGDAAQMPTFTSGGGGSDPTYTTIVGTDNYPDIFVGRFSAETPAQLDTQIDRTITYERDQVAGNVWPQYGTGIASSQGPGHYGEYDYQHMDNIRADLLAYGYFDVDRIYDPGASSTMVTNALNAGRGIVNYCGHGSMQAWTTTGFSNSHVDALVNDNMLPFICSVACQNGDFTAGTCFGEAWLRAMNEGTGEPTGAIATYMSSINQYWDEPMEGQDEVVDLLVGDAMRTAGGLFYNGSCRMMDVYGSSGVDMFLTWIVFGDPSVAVRTKVPEVMTVTHTGTLFLGANSYDVEALGIAGARCALYNSGVLYGTAFTDATGRATIVMDQPPVEPMDLTLTVTAYNQVTYVGSVEVIPAEGPYLLISAVEYLDGNGDGTLNAGEGVNMRVQLRNVGIATAAGVSAVISTESEYIGITTDTQTYPDVAPGEMVWSDGDYVFAIDPTCPDAHAVHMPVVITGEQRLTWNANINFIVHAPAITVAAVDIDDTAGGDGNLRLDPGETATVTVTLDNDGSYALNGITGILSCGHPMIHITTDTGTNPGIGAGGSGTLVPSFVVTVDPEFPMYQADFLLEITGSNSYAHIFDLPLPIGGFYETIEDNPDWPHYVVSGGTFVDQWHVSSERNHSPGGTYSWKCGDTGTGTHANLLDAGLETPPVEIGPGGELRFWMWIDAEVSGMYPGRAYDGGLVEMSVDGGPFTQITPVGGYPYTIRPGSNPGPFPDGTPVFSGTFDWQQEIFDLGETTGTVVFRFRFGSDGADAQEGWHIDDVEVLGLNSFSDSRELTLVPSHIMLQQNAPNPCGTATRISFALPAQQRVDLAIYDPAGRVVRTLLRGPVGPGQHSVVWTGDNDAGRPAPSGVYYYRLQASGETHERSLILLR